MMELHCITVRGKNEEKLVRLVRGGEVIAEMTLGEWSRLVSQPKHFYEKRPK